MPLTTRVATLLYAPDDPYDSYAEYFIGRESTTGTIRVYEDTDDGWDCFAAFTPNANLSPDDIVDRAENLIAAHGLEEEGECDRVLDAPMTTTSFSSESKHER